MKLVRIIGVLFGGMMMYFAVGAYYFNEAASKTETGQIGIGRLL